MPSDSVSDPRILLGLSPISDDLSSYLKDLAGRQTSVPIDKAIVPDVKAYPDALYMNYYKLGLSLMFVTKDGSKTITESDVHGERLKLENIDLYNVLPGSESKLTSSIASSGSLQFLKHPAPEIVLSLVSSKDGKPRAGEVKITTSSTGKDLVSVLGEPDRKGGGGGPSTGSIGIWCEWSRDGIMVEFGGEEARGPKAWETGKDAKWKVLTLFKPS